MSVLRPFLEEGVQLLRTEEEFLQRMSGIRAVLFDWDGVFNGGWKDIAGNSPFSEVGAMGTNLLRFALWSRSGTLPKTAIITGQHNAIAQGFGEREHLDGIYMGFTDKRGAFQPFLEQHGLEAREVLFIFDDVLDLSVARVCGARIFVADKASVLVREHVRATGDADAITARSGAENGLRQACDLAIASLGASAAVLEERVAYSETYQDYLRQRNAVRTALHLHQR